MSKILKSTFTISGWTAVSRVLGFVRDIMFSWFFGSSYATDAFFAASTAINSFRKISSEGSVYNVFLPRYKILLTKTKQYFARGQSQKKTNTSQDEMAEFISDIVKLLVVCLLILLVFAEIFMPYVVFVFAPGFFFNEDALVSQQAIFYARILFPYLLFISITSLFSAILNANNRFWVFAFVPIIYNIAFIVTLSMLLILQKVEIEYICISIVISGVLQLLFTLYFINKYSLLPSKVKFFSLSMPNFSNKSLREFLYKFPHSLVSSILIQISAALDNIFGSFLYEGAISYLYYANRLVFLPIGLISFSIYNVLISKLTKVNDGIRFSLIRNALKLSDFLAFPSCLGLILMAEEIVSLFFGYGSFGTDDIIKTKNVLIVLAPIIILTNYIKILQANFYSITNTKRPMYSMFLRLLIFVAFCLALTDRYGHVGIGLATFIATFFEALYLFLLSNKQTRKTFLIAILDNLLKFSPSLIIVTIIIVLSKTNAVEGILSKELTIILTILLSIIVYLTLNYKTLKQLRSV